jgi:hypothetical protein
MVCHLGPDCFREEDTRPEKKESDSTGDPFRSSLRMEQNQNGGWSVAQSSILGTTIKLERLIKRGYESMFSYYKKVSLQLNACPPFPAGTAVYEIRLACPEESKGTVVACLPKADERFPLWLTGTGRLLD